MKFKIRLFQYIFILSSINLTYQIKDEKIDGDTAIITTEIEVLD